MRRFDEILDLAAGLHGGRDTFARMLAETRPLAPEDIAAIPDNRILAAMTRRVFCAGFSSKVIDAKWEAFESAFDQFDPALCAWITEERFDELLKDRDIVRNGAKIKSVLENGRFLTELAEKHGSAAHFLAEWLFCARKQGAINLGRAVSLIKKSSKHANRCGSNDASIWTNLRDQNLW